MTGLTVNQVAKLTGVTARTLHHYHNIGLLIPKINAGNNYRYYDENDLARLQQILFFKELDFSLKEIKHILDAPFFEPRAALEKQHKLLKLKQQRLNRLIKLLEKIMNGEIKMNFAEFNQAQIAELKAQYKKEVEERWGNTEAYRESLKKTDAYSEKDWQRIDLEASQIYEKFLANLDLEPNAPKIQELVAKWQNYITKNFYNCTKEILAGLGKMYVEDERFHQSIDKYGTGLAEFMSKAIAIYCRS